MPPDDPNLKTAQLLQLRQDIRNQEKRVKAMRNKVANADKDKIINESSVFDPNQGATEYSAKEIVA